MAGKYNSSFNHGYFLCEFHGILIRKFNSIAQLKSNLFTNETDFFMVCCFTIFNPDSAC